MPKLRAFLAVRVIDISAAYELGFGDKVSDGKRYHGDGRLVRLAQ